MTATTFDQLRAAFPSADKCIHLNHAGTSPIARPVADAVQTVLAELMSDDSFLAYKNHMRRQESLRGTLSRMMGVNRETIAFVRNTSHGLSIAADSIPFEPGENVVVPAIEYPANVYPWMAQRQHGVETRFVAPQNPDDHWLDEAALLAACDTRTRVLAVSWVQWGTGQRLDLDRLGRACRERGILFVVDIVQGLGALRPDLSQVDVAAAGCHKWMLAPGGIGALTIRPEVLPTLRLTNIGWNSVVDPIDWDRIHFDLRPDSQRFEEGTPNILGTAALNASLELLESVGLDTVEDRVLTLAERARNGLSARGYRLIAPTFPRSGIVAFRHPAVSNAEILSMLQAAGVVAAVRGGNVRFSPHAYNTPAEIDAAVATLPAV